MRIKIKTYKGIDLFYDEDDGRIYFEFDGENRGTKYVFEAKKIIDEPVWEDCDLEGYFADGYIDRFIGKAKATRKDIKSGKPDWQFKGRYDTEYKGSNRILGGCKKVFPKTKHNYEIYDKWE